MADATVVLSSLIEGMIGVASLGVVTVAWRYREKRVGRPVIVMAVATSLYALVTVLQSFVTDPIWWRLVNNSGYPLGATLAVASLSVVVEFTERESLQRPVVGGLFVGFVLLDFVVAMTDPIHMLMNTSVRIVDGVAVGTHGPLYFVHTVVSLGIVAVAVGLLVAEYPATTGIYRRQTVAVIGAFVVGMAGFAVESFIPVYPALDVATVGMLGWCGLLLWGVFTADFLDIVPIGRHRVVRSIEDPVVTLDESGRVVDSNPAARQWADIETDWEGTPVASFFASFPDLVAAIEAESARDIALDVGGETRHVTLSVSPIYRNEQAASSPVGRAVVMRDVTEQVRRQQELEAANEQLARKNEQLEARESELTYRTALFEAITESTDAGVLVVSTDREILWYNSQFRELWGLPTDVLDDTADNNAAIDHVREMVADTEAFVAATETLYEPPYEPARTEIELTDGRWFDRYTAPITDDETMYGLLTLTRDITDRKQYETRIETQNRRLERLADVIAHDMRTPLSTAKKYLQLLAGEFDDPGESAERSIEGLETTLDRLQRFADHVPRLARESTNVDSPIACDLSTVVAEAWAVTDTGDLELRIEGDRTLAGDPSRLQQAFENLFENVVEYAADTPAGDSAASTVRVTTHDSGFAVADDGPGIDEDRRETIFEYGVSSGESSGIGLAIVRSIVEAHGWEIRVTEGPAGGAKFVVDTG